MDPRLRAWGLGVSAVLLATLVSPLGWSLEDDSFPLSTYPMFAQGRDEPTLTVEHVLAVDDRGQRSPVSPRIVANGNHMQAASTVRRAIAEDRGARLCQRVARELSGEASVKRVEVVRSRYHVVRYFAEGRRPLERKAFARCSVPPSGAP